MKKYFAIIVLTLCAVFTLAACSSKVPENMHEDTYKYGKSALEIMDNYNSGKISKDDAYDRLESLVNALKGIKIDKDAGHEEYMQYLSNDKVRLNISSFQWHLKGGNGGNTWDDADELREILELD